jgi:hypothetical protein
MYCHHPHFTEKETETQGVYLKAVPTGRGQHIRRPRDDHEHGNQEEVKVAGTKMPRGSTAREGDRETAEALPGDLGTILRTTMREKDKLIKADLLSMVGK